MNVQSGTLIDIELLRDEFTAAIEPPFRKGHHEFETGKAVTDLSNAEGGGSAPQSDIRMAMRYTHAMEDAKRRAVEAIAIGSKRNAGETPAIPVPRDHNVTNEKPAAGQIAVSG
jgi:hypothetical protein